MIMEEKTLSHKVVCMLYFGPLNLILRSQIKFVENYFFLENYVTSEGAVSHNVLYYQQLSIACYQVSFYANNYVE